MGLSLKCTVGPRKASTRPTGISHVQLPAKLRRGWDYFFTVVTHQRRPFLTTDLARATLRSAFEVQQSKRPFEIDAIVLLPDHIHTIWTLPQGDSDYSIRWAQIKELFTRKYLAAGGVEAETTPNRTAHQNRSIWQHRFWEHTIRDEDDYQRCIDYIHWNPVKHGLVTKPREYPWSSFHRYVRLGLYPIDWGSGPIQEIPGAEWE